MNRGRSSLYLLPLANRKPLKRFKVYDISTYLYIPHKSAVIPPCHHNGSHQRIDEGTKRSYVTRLASRSRSPLIHKRSLNSQKVLVMTFPAGDASAPRFLYGNIVKRVSVLMRYGIESRPQLEIWPIRISYRYCFRLQSSISRLQLCSN